MDRVDSDDEQENKIWEQATGKNGHVYLVDFRKPMFQSSDDSYFHQSFQCCLDAMLQIAREQRRDFVSFVLFGTSKSIGKYAPANTVLLQTLQTPTVDNISKIKEMIQGNFQDILQKYGQETEFSLANTLSYCKGLLHNCKSTLFDKSIVLFTCDDNPTANDENAEHVTRKRAEELHVHHIYFDVVGFGDFNSSKFFKELVLTSRGELLKDWIETDPIKKIKDLKKEIGYISKKFSRRFSIFYLGEEAKLKIVILKLYREPQKLIWTSKSSQVVSENPTEQNESNPEKLKNEDEENETEPVEESTEQPTTERYKIFPMIGGQYIPMSKNEIKWFESKVAKGLTLIGFRPLSSIPIHLAADEPSFIIPDTRDSASVGLFSALHESCLQREVVAMCWYSITISSNPSTVILYPVESSKYSKDKWHPAGFHVIKIPFSDSINDPAEVTGFSEIDASDSQREAASGIVKKTTINWNPETFSDIEYKKRISMIEAIAMEYPEMPPLEDDTDIDLKDIAEHLGEFNKQFIDCSHLPPEAVGKRTAPKGDQETSTKGAKTYDTMSLISMVKDGKAEKLTVAELKELLRGEGIKSLSAMKKPRLIAIANSRFKDN